MSKTHNLYAALRAAFPADLDATAIEVADGATAGGRYSWRDLDRGSAMLANLLASLHLPQGARVAVQLEKSVESLMLYLGVLRAGYVYLPLNTAYQAAEVEYFLGNAEPSVVVCTAKSLGWMEPMASSLGVKRVFTLEDNRTGSLLERAGVHADVHASVARGRDDLAAILYTSGTTGRSKGAMLSHGNLLSNAQVLRDYWDWREGDVLIHALPIFHAHGLFVASHGALVNGSRMIWFQRFDRPRRRRAPARGHGLHGRADCTLRMLEEAALTKSACRQCGCSSAARPPCCWRSPTVARAHRPHHPRALRDEPRPVMLTSNPCKAEDGQRRGRTVGFPLPGVGVRIRDEQDQDVPSGEIGGIQVRGPNVFGGYWRMTEKTAEEFTADGWFKSGDLGRCDADGRVDHRRAQQGPRHQRRLQRLPRRDRGLAHRACRQCRSRP